MAAKKGSAAKKASAKGGDAPAKGSAAASEQSVAKKVAAHAEKHDGKAVYDLSMGESLPGPDPE